MPHLSLSACTFCVSVAGLAPVAHADLLFPLSQTRTVNAADQGETASDSATDFDLWDATALVGNLQTGPYAVASQHSDILTDSIIGEGHCNQLFGDDPSAETVLDVTFDVLVPVSYTLQGLVSASRSASAAVLLTGPDVNEQFGRNNGFQSFYETGALQVGQYHLRALARIGNTFTSSDFADFEATLTLTPEPSALLSLLILLPMARRAVR